MRSPRSWWWTVRWLPMSVRNGPRWIRVAWYASNVVSWSPLIRIEPLHRANMWLSSKLYAMTRNER